MKVYKNHVSAGDNSLRRRMHYIKYPLRSSRSVPDGMGRIDANRHARQALHDRHMGKIDKVAVRLTDICFHSAQCKDDLAIALTGEILGSVE